MPALSVAWSYRVGRSEVMNTLSGGVGPRRVFLLNLRVFGWDLLSKEALADVPSHALLLIVLCQRTAFHQSGDTCAVLVRALSDFGV